MSNQLPETGFLRIWQILGCKKKGIVPLIPVGRSTWFDGIKTGKYPQPVKLDQRTTAYRVEDVKKLIDAISRGETHVFDVPQKEG